MGGATLGVFKPTPVGIVMAESNLTLAKALLYNRQARCAQRLSTRPHGHDEPEDIMSPTKLGPHNQCQGGGSAPSEGHGRSAAWTKHRNAPG